MGKNSSVYNKVYQSRKREELIAKLGGKCEVCGIKQDLILHRIFSLYNTNLKGLNEQNTFDGQVGIVMKFAPVSTAVMRERNKILRSNPDNMVLLCPTCYSALQRTYGRKKRFGRREIEIFKCLK